MKTGTLDMSKHKLTIADTAEEDEYTKDTAFWAPEVAAAVFAEEGIENVLVLVTVPVSKLTAVVCAITKEKS
jgi:hypothetical protein